mgnify:CR=1 FL=1
MQISTSNGIIDYTIQTYLLRLKDDQVNGVLSHSEPIIVGSDSTFIYQEVKGEGHGNAVLTACEEELFCQVAETLGNMAFNLDRNHMRSMINIYLFNCGLTDEDFTSITDQTLSRIMDRYLSLIHI